jgi:hypothetical protein
MDEEPTGRIVIQPDITSSGARNPPEEWDPAEDNYSSWKLIHTGKIKMREKSSKR